MIFFHNFAQGGLFGHGYQCYSKFELLIKRSSFLGSEVMKGLREKQKAKMRQNVPESALKLELEKEKVARRSEMEDNKVNFNQKHYSFFIFNFTISISNQYIISAIDLLNLIERELIIEWSLICSVSAYANQFFITKHHFL